MNHRESIARIEGSLQDQVELANIDRLTAFSLGSKHLGSYLWRVKYAFESEFYRLAVQELSKVTNTRYDVAEMALCEWLQPSCLRCTGAKSVMIGERKATCPSCNGDGLHRYTDTSRAHRLRISLAQVRKLSKQIRKLQDLIGTVDRAVNAGMSVRLSDK